MNTVHAPKYAPKFIDNKSVQVTQRFAKNAKIFGTPEYKLWREILHDCPKAQMVTKTIKKNPDKKINTKNMTYKNMADYIRKQNNAPALMEEFKKQIALSKVQTSPYYCVLAWFSEKFAGYDSYKEFFIEAKKKNSKNDLFALDNPSASSKNNDKNAS